MIVLQVSYVTSTITTTTTTLCPKNDTFLACYNFDVCQLILIVFGTNVTERAGSQIVIYFSTSPK